MIERRESELIAQDLRNLDLRKRTKQRQAVNQGEKQTLNKVPAPKSAQPRATAANTPYE